MWRVVPMEFKYKGGVVVLDDGDARVDDLLGRVNGVFRNVYRLTDHDVPDAREKVIPVGHRHLDVKTLVHKMHENEAFLGLVASGADPVVTISDFLSAARPALAHGYPAFVLISAKPEKRYHRVAIVADVRQPLTTGSLALAGVGIAARTHASMDVLMLGGDPASPPASWEDARELFTIDEHAELLELAVQKAHELGLRMHWVALGEAADRDRVVLDAVRDGGYDLVVDDLRPLDVGPRVGRLGRVRNQLTSGKSPDTAYRLLRDAPCDVAIVVDAVNMRLVPSSAVKAGAVAALSLGVVGVASLPQAASASTSAETVAASAPLDVALDAATEPAAPGQTVTPPPSADVIPDQVTEEQLDQVDQAVAQQESALDAEQQELADLQQQQAAADQAVADAGAAIDSAEADLAAAQNAEQAIKSEVDYSQGGMNRLSPEDQDLAEGQLKKAEYATSQAQADIDAAKASLAEAQAQATDAAAATAAQQQVVDAQQANVGSWTAFDAAVEANAPQIVSPMPGYEVTTHYGEAGDMWSSGHHTGTDFAAPEGTPIHAAQDGVVIAAGPSGPYGNQTSIQAADGTVTTYSHQSEIDVEVGQTVEAGQVIGEVGATGNVTGPHLHFEVFDANGNRIDPEAWLGDAI